MKDIRTPRIASFFAVALIWTLAVGQAWAQTGDPYTDTGSSGMDDFSGSDDFGNDTGSFDTGTGDMDFSDSGSFDTGNSLQNGTGNENPTGSSGATGAGITWEGSVDTNFTDIGDSFARDDILRLAAMWVVSGYGDGTFRPNASTSRAEFLAMTLRAMAIPVDTSITTSDYSDVPASWAPYAEKAKEYSIEWASSNGERRFRPNAPITRAEAVKMLLNIAGINAASAPLTQSGSQFADVSEDWMIPYVEAAKDLGIVNGQETDGQLMFRPNDPITRAEAAKIIGGVAGQ